MSQIDWNRKLTSRKWWLAVSAFIVGIIGMFSKEYAEQIGGIILLIADIIAYTMAESYVDAAEKKGENDGTELE